MTADAENSIPIGRYRHFKGNYYRVLAVASHSETLEKMVVYQAEYGKKQIWVRPISMWTQMVEYQGEIQPRFELVEE